MYVLHRPNQHKGRRVNTDASPTAAPDKDSLQQDYKGGGTAAALKFQSKLKIVMCANLCLISEDVDKIFKEAKNQKAGEKGVGINQESFYVFY